MRESNRERILERRAHFVAAALSLAGCQQSPKPVEPTKSVVTPSVAEAALAGPPHADAGADTAPLDSDGDGLPDAQDKCPMQWGSADKEGCPGPCLRIVFVQDIDIGERIYFAEK